jgi:hypothetical protein
MLAWMYLRSRYMPDFSLKFCIVWTPFEIEISKSLVAGPSSGCDSAPDARREFIITKLEIYATIAKSTTSLMNNTHKPKLTREHPHHADTRAPQQQTK